MVQNLAISLQKNIKDMEPSEFYKCIRLAKEMCGKSNVELIIATGKSEGTLKNMWSGRYDNEMFGYFIFLNAMGYVFQITTASEVHKICSVADLRKWLITTMKAENKNYTALGAMLGVSRMTAKRIMEGGNIKLSVFLKFLNMKRWSIEIVPK